MRQENTQLNNQSFSEPHLHIPNTKQSIDYLILFVSIVLLGIGLVMVYSSSQVWAFIDYNDNSFFFKRQLVFAVVGLVVMLIAAYFPYKIYQKLSPLALAVCFVLMILVLTGFGNESGGATRWLDLGFIAIQPSEFVKIAVIMYLAGLYAKKQHYMHDFTKGLLPPLVVVGIFFTLIIMQRDLGTAMSLLFFVMVMIFCSGAQFRHMIGLSLLATILFFTFALTQPYRLQRITSFMDPWADRLNSGYQLTHSLMAIGNGGVSGMGIGNSIQKFLYLPEAHTDFIFAILAEELGLIGVTFVLGCFVALIIRGIVIANRCPDFFGSLLAIGIVSMLGIQALINIGVVSGSLPVTGITLPFISYGGSSLLLTLFSVGILLNISRYSPPRASTKGDH